jgi:hypothetical protein
VIGISGCTVFWLSESNCDEMLTFKFQRKVILPAFCCKGADCVEHVRDQRNQVGSSCFQINEFLQLVGVRLCTHVKMNAPLQTRG